VSNYILVGNIYRDNFEEPRCGIRKAMKTQRIPDGWEVVTSFDGWSVFDEHGVLNSCYEVFPMLRVVVEEYV
jgi:hypothetical protein